MKVTPSFRRAVSRDAPAILALIKHLAETEKRPEAVTVSLPELQDLISRPGSPATTTVMLNSDRIIIGYAMTARKFSSFKGYGIVYIEDIVVSPQMQGQGLGLDFIAELARQAEETGAARLEWSAEDVNSHAIAFYDRIGARRESGRVHFLMDNDEMKALAGRHDKQLGTRKGSAR